MRLIETLSTNPSAADEEQIGKVAANPVEDPQYRARVKDAAEKFESFFIASMLRQMRSAARELADDDSPVRRPMNQDMLEMADGKLADTMAGQHAFGIADAILRQLLPAPSGSAVPAEPAALLRKG